MPLITVIIPIRNRANEVERILNNLEQQTHSDFEVVIVNDGSIDETEKLLEATSTKLSLRSTTIPHSGPSAARNQGAKIATTPYLMFADSDDSLEPDAIEQFTGVIKESAPQIIHGGIVTHYPDSRNAKLELPEASPISHPVLRPFLSGTYCIETDLFWSVGGFTESLRFAEHRELALKLARSERLEDARIRAIPKILYSYRYRDSAVRTYHKEQAHAAKYILKNHRASLEKVKLVLTYHKLAVTSLAKSGNLRELLNSCVNMLLEFPFEREAYSTALKAPYHLLNQKALKEKLFTITWFLKRPTLYPELFRLLRKRIYGPGEVGGSVDDARAWCEGRFVTASEALKSIPNGRPALPLRELHPDIFQQAELEANQCPNQMGGAADLELLYGLCEALQAKEVLETGVAYCWSSLAILLSLRKRKGARLQSTDMPYPKRGTEDFVGCVVPAGLRNQWNLNRLPDREGIPKALSNASTPLDLVHYDSDKSYEGRRWAYPILWDAIRPGGLFVSDDIRDNTAFRDFAEQIGERPTVVKCGDKYVGFLQKSNKVLK